MTVADRLFDCCGVVAKWEFLSDFNGRIDFQIWENVDTANKKATMKAFNPSEGDVKTASVSAPEHPYMCFSVSFP